MELGTCFKRRLYATGIIVASGEGRDCSQAEAGAFGLGFIELDIVGLDAVVLEPLAFF